MAEQRELNRLPALDVWEELAPDPAAMEDLVSVMMIGVQTEQQPMAATETFLDEARAVRREERRFRLITATWAFVGVVAYLGWAFARPWFYDHPYLAVLAAVALAGCLLIPLLAVPLHNAEVDRKGGASA